MDSRIRYLFYAATLFPGFVCTSVAEAQWVQGRLSCPEQIFEDADLKRAWAEYETDTEVPISELGNAIQSQIDSARKDGDFAEVTKWMNVLEQFRENGVLPNEPKTLSKVRVVAKALERGKQDLGKAYKALIKKLTQQNRIDDAGRVQQEWNGLQEQRNLRVASGELNLLRGLDIKRQAIHGGWGFDRGLTNDGRVGQARFRLAESTPSSFTLEMSFQRRSGTDALAVLFPVGGKYVALMIRPDLIGLDTVGGITNRFHSNSTTKRGQFADPLKPEALHKVEVVVKSSPRETDASIDVTYDGEKVVQWNGATAALEVSPDWNSPVVSGIEVGSFHAGFVIRTFLMRAAR